MKNPDPLTGRSQLPAAADCLIQADGLDLEPLGQHHAVELYPLLADAQLHTFLGGEPPASAEDLQQVYASRLSRRSPDGRQLWLNWVVRLRPEGAAIGYVQATIDSERTLVAWVIASAHQGRGHAAQAATALVTWLQQLGVPTIQARIHPFHTASQRVAKRAGFLPTGQQADGEEVWTL